MAADKGPRSNQEPKPITCILNLVPTTPTVTYSTLQRDARELRVQFIRNPRESRVPDGWLRILQSSILRTLPIRAFTQPKAVTARRTS